MKSMQNVRTILLNKSVFEDNDRQAEELRAYLKHKKVFLINVMSSPGAGKTTALIALIGELKKSLNIGVMEADIDSDVDAVKVAQKTGVRSIQLHTGGMCHLDAAMTRQGLDEMGIEGLDLVFLENVGNLVCPAEYDTGAHIDMMILSVPEGDDKPLKYPLIFKKSGLVLINKIDTLPYFNFDLQKCKNNIKLRNPDSAVIAVSAKDGTNIAEAADFIKNTVDNFLGE